MSSTLVHQTHKYLEILRVLFEETAELRSLALQCEPCGSDEVHPLVDCLAATVSELLDELGFGLRKDTAMWVLLDWAMDPSHCGVYRDFLRVNFWTFDEVAKDIELHGWE